MKTNSYNISAHHDTWSPLPFSEISMVLSQALDVGSVNRDLSCFVMFDLDLYRERLRSLKNAFGADTLQAMAIKANPLSEVLRIAAEEMMGAEAASIGELYLAQRAGFPAEATVYDSPVKTRDEIEGALCKGIYLNADSFAELDRIAGVVTQHALTPRVGLRINPQVGYGSIAYTSTAGPYSKFGVPLDECRKEIIAAYRNHSWLNGIHVHIGSQTCSTEMLLEGVDRIVRLAEEIENETGRRIATFDLGGGLPAQYHRDQVSTTAPEYAALLKTRFPTLFESERRLVFEFGRHIHANLGWAVSRVENTKPHGGLLTAYIHFGADMFVRECYNPKDWHHDIIVLDPCGKPKLGATQKTNIAGPLCFSGDLLCTNRELPPIEAGDYVVICDVGAYSFSMWSRYNSRPMPAIFGYDRNGGFCTLKSAETLDDAVRCWG